MSRPGVRTHRSVVDVIAQRGYDHIQRLEKRRNQMKALANRTCSHENCKVRLSMYNDTEYCSQHQRGNIQLPKFL